MSETLLSLGEKSQHCGRNEFDPQYESKYLVAHIIREVNRQKITYNQLREVFQKVRLRCGLRAKKKARKLYLLPTQEDIDKFYSIIKSPKHTLLYQTLEGTGLREAELCNLEVKRIDFASNSMFITGKGNKDRIVLFSDSLKQKMALHLEGRNNKFLFETNRHSRYSCRRLQQLTQTYREKAGIVDKQLSPHTFRHLYCTRLAGAGVTEEKREILCGHAPGGSMQSHYTHLGIAGLKDELLVVLEKLNL